MPKRVTSAVASRPSVDFASPRRWAFISMRKLRSANTWAAVRKRSFSPRWKIARGSAIANGIDVEGCTEQLRTVCIALFSFKLIQMYFICQSIMHVASATSFCSEQLTVSMLMMMGQQCRN